MAEPTFEFELDGSVLGEDSAERLLLATARSDVLTALRDDAPFPERTVELGEITVGVDGGTEVALDGGTGRVTFSAQSNAGLLVTPERTTMLDHLPLGDPIADGLAADEDDDATSYALLTWGYALEAGARGAVALGGGVRAELGGTGTRSSGFAVVQRFRPDAGARDVLARTVRAWRLPRQVNAPNDLPPGTWLVAEVDGSLALSLAVQAGYDFSWVRQTQLSGLSGDIALRVEAGLAATVGFEASGRYALLLRRDSLGEGDRRLRLQLFKQRKEGWSFALDANATVQADADELAPGSLDELLRAVLGVQAGQLLDDLDALQEWSDPEESLGELLAGAGVERAKELLAELTGLDPEAELDEARDRLVDLLERWRELDGRVASALWSELEDETAITEIRDLARQVRSALTDEAELRTLLRRRLGDAGFFASPAGRWLESVAGEGVLRLVNSSKGLQALRRAADTTLDLLDESRVEALLRRLRGEIERVFRLDRLEAAIQGAVDASDPEALDAWARRRLARFLDDRPTVQRLQEVLEALAAIRKRSRDVYSRTMEALQRRSRLSFASTYRETTTREALIDVELDFGAQDAAGELPELLRETIDGRMNRLFVRRFPGVTLREATLSHQIGRRAHVEISLPWYGGETKRVARSLATVEAVEDDGRLLLYEGDATDEVERTTDKATRESRLTLVTALEARPGVKLHTSGTLTSSYSFHQALARTRTAQLGRQLRGFVDAYFPGEFPATGDGATSGSLHDWLDALDAQAEALEGNGRGNLGNTLLSLQVTLAPEVAGAWLQAPAEGDPAYGSMSRHLQGLLKELIPSIYFRDLDRYRPGFVPAAVLFAYAAMPPLTDVRLQGRKLVEKKLRDLYWDFQDPKLLEAVLDAEETRTNLKSAARRGRSLLERTPGMDERVEDFAHPEGFARRVRSALFDSSGKPRPQLIALLDADRQIVQGAARAGAAMARFRKKATKEPEEAIAALATFGDALTRAFSSQLANVYLKGALRPFGVLLFAEAAAGFRGSLQIESSAFLQLAVVEAGATFPPEGFPDETQADPEDVLVAQNLVSVPFAGSPALPGQSQDSDR